MVVNDLLYNAVLPVIARLWHLARMNWDIRHYRLLKLSLMNIYLRGEVINF
jgi:hypothetical protein